MIYDDYVLYTDKYKQIYGEKTIVFIEIGSFFEIYGVNNNSNEISGANMIEIGNLLNIQVSRKNKSILENSRENPMMAGFPNHSLKKFIDVLILHNYTNVIVEQVTPPPNPKREVTRIISPSTYIDNLTSYEKNTLMVVYIEELIHWKTSKKSFGLGVSCVDLSTSRTTSIESYVDTHSINEELVRLCLLFNPKELVICSTKDIEVYEPNNVYFHNKISKLSEDYFNKKFQNVILNKVFIEKGILSPIEFLNMERKQIALVSFVYMLEFVYEHNEKLLLNITKPVIAENDTNLILTNNALFQLDIVGKKHCLCDILNNCKTSIGKRFFKEILSNPIKEVKRLNEMYEKTDLYLKDDLYNHTRPILKQTMDIERIINIQKINPFDIVNLYNSLIEVEKLQHLIVTSHDSTIKESTLYIETTLDIETASKYKLSNIEENIFKNGFDNELDKITNQIEEILLYFNQIQNKYSNYLKLERSDKYGLILITTNKKYGEMKKEIKECYESVKIKQTHVRLQSSELDLKNNQYIFLKETLRTRVQSKFQEYCITYLDKFNKLFLEAISFIEEVDFFSNNAYNSFKMGLTKPKITDSKSHINCQQLRHPIIEYIQKDTKYIPNDVCLNENSSGIILYGINASGKSSLMKSIGISIIMAQAGMFVPATNYNFYPYNDIHTRILNNDNLYKKQSTFTVEMSEIRNILNNCSASSLVIGDELCSGTESISAISLVTAGIIHLSAHKSSFIFATHLHELSKIDEVKSLKNVNIQHLSVHYDNSLNTIIYDRKLKNGSGDTLYGLEVCKSLDLDPNFLLTANRVRKNLLKMSSTIVHNKKSNFNHSIYKDVCYICKKTAEDVHHIEHQCTADENNKINHYHKNSEFNLVALCKSCHHKTHKDEINIEGFVDTYEGKKLKYKVKD
jgi:DNA mismatch repair protein MutS